MASRVAQISEKLKEKFRLMVYNDETLEAVWSTHISRLTIISIVASIFVVSSIIVIILFIYTPLNLLLPHQSDIELQRTTIQNAARIDSLERQVKMYEKSYSNFMRILRGEPIAENYKPADSLMASQQNIDFTKSKHDSILRKQIEQEEQFNLSQSVSNNTHEQSIERMHFFLPVKGMISNKYDAKNKHFGIDIVAPNNEPILAALDGTVISATWTLATGYVIQLQHDNNVVTFYKHNSVLLKEAGDHVKAGEPIAIIGNTGENSSGPHLHFELWYNGSPLDPEDYLTF